MRIGLLTDNPNHPLLVATAALLTEQGHRIETLSPTAHFPIEPADVYLLKARTPAAITLARALETHGARVLNAAAATARCQDRMHMARLAASAGLPFPATTSLQNLQNLQNLRERPIVVKSRHSRRGDLVARVNDHAELEQLMQRWSNEPVVVQELAPHTGWDHKLWVIGGKVFAALRRSELTPTANQLDRPLAMPPVWADLARQVGQVFGLDIYGVDILRVGGTPLIVDVNAFPGIRGQRSAPHALAALALTPPPCHAEPQRPPEH
jgi:ribosomal protein S6--L-glutamate ligase